MVMANMNGEREPRTFKFSPALAPPRHIEREDIRPPRQPPRLQLLRELRHDVPSPCGRRSLERFRERDFDRVRWAKRWAKPVSTYAVSRYVFARSRIVPYGFVERLRRCVVGFRFRIPTPELPLISERWPLALRLNMRRCSH
jgi:hypothetical protein